jgi:molybdopterin/thiamine biosynthesis adenylyltransferase
VDRPRVKTVHRPYRIGDKIRIGAAFGVAGEIVDSDGVIWSLMTAMDGVRTADEVARSVHRKYPRYGVEQLRDAVAELAATGYFEDAAVVPDMPAADVQRYSRSVAYYSHVDRTPRASTWEAYRRMTASHVVLLGVGGVGSACAYCLVASGIHRLTLVDRDAVETSNLNRQMLYTTADIGRPKVRVAAERLAAVRPDVRVDARQVLVESATAVRGFFAEADLVVLAADGPAEMQQWCNRAALDTGTPWVAGFYDGPQVSVTLYTPGAGPCWRCQWEAAQAGTDRPDERMGAPRVHMATAATATVAGSLAAHVALAHLTGIAAPQPGEPVVWSTARLGHAFVWRAPRRTDCQECGQGG